MYYATASISIFYLSYLPVSDICINPTGSTTKFQSSSVVHPIVPVTIYWIRVDLRHGDMEIIPDYPTKSSVYVIDSTPIMVH